MNLSKLLLALMLLVSLPLQADEYREVTWDDLMPEGWFPEPPQEHDVFAQEFEGGIDTLSYTEVAPIVGDLDKQKLKLPGYIIPIKFDALTVSEFLLVPYMGACIHVPPPPENQIVYVTLATPTEMTELWTPVWVSGIMQTEMLETQYAVAGYHLKAALTEVYEF